MTVTLNPGDNIQDAVNNNPGASFSLNPGLYRQSTPISPTTGQQFIGAAAGVVISGAIVLTAWKQQGSLWSCAGLPAGQGADGGVAGADPMAVYPNELFLDSARLKRVAALADVVPGTWFFDMTASAAWIADDPTGREAELSVTELCFGNSGASGVVISNLTIEKYANPAENGAIQWGMVNLTVSSVEVRLCHANGIHLFSGSKAQNCHSHHNGQMGVGAWKAAGAQIVNCEIDHNNTAGYSTGWDAGGMKIDDCSSATVSGCFIHDNAGPGLWFDDGCSGATVSGNVIAGNADSGVLAEISSGIAITGNQFQGNGLSTAGSTGQGANQVVLHDSSGCTVSGNYIEIGQSQGNGVQELFETRGTYTLQNNVIEQNQIVHLGQSGHDGIWAYDSETTVLAWSNAWDKNAYTLPADFPFFAVGQAFYTWAQLRTQFPRFEPNGTMTFAQATSRPIAWPAVSVAPPPAPQPSPSPAPAPSPVPAPAPAPQPTSALTFLTPGSGGSVVDGAGNTWTVDKFGNINLNGSRSAASGWQTHLLMLIDGQVYIQGFGLATVYRWAAGWQAVALG